MHAPIEQTLIVVDRDDKVLEYARRSVCHTGQGRMHRAVLVMLYNAQGQVLLQHRKHALWNNYWDLTGATHPLRLGATSETYEEATARLLKVEWGVEAPVRRLLSFTYFAQFGEACENELCVLLAGRYDGPLAPNPEHALGHRWATLAECAADLRAGTPDYTPWARIAIDRLLAEPAGLPVL